MSDFFGQNFSGKIMFVETDEDGEEYTREEDFTGTYEDLRNYAGSQVGTFTDSGRFVSEWIIL